jgi:hypothetical protein
MSSSMPRRDERSSPGNAGNAALQEAGKQSAPNQRLGAEQQDGQHPGPFLPNACEDGGPKPLHLLRAGAAVRS